MAITYKIFLDQRRVKENNSYPLKMRITLNRRSKEVPLNVLLPVEAWDEAKQRVRPSHPNEKLITLKINKSLKELQETSLKFDTTDKVISLDNLANVVTKKQPIVTNFLSYSKNEIENLMKVGRVGNAISYNCAVTKLIKYCKNDNIKFEAIDYNFLEKFTHSMLAEGMKINAVAVYMREIRAIYNKAIKAELVEQKYYPFNKYKIKTAKTISRALTVEEMKKILEVDLKPNSVQWHSRNYFLLSFCLIGINFTDLFKLTPDSIQNNRIVFSRSKTKKIYSIYLQPKAMEILSHYFKPENNSDYLLPVLSKGDTPIMVKRKALQAIKTTNEYLYRMGRDNGFRQDITTYFARYSWANIARSLGYSKDLIAESLGHEYGNAVTGIYLDNYGNEVIDEANSKVISAVFN